MSRRDRTYQSDTIERIGRNEKVPCFLMNDTDYRIEDNDITSLADAIGRDNTMLQKLAINIQHYEMNTDVFQKLLLAFEKSRIRSLQLGGSQINQHHSEILGTMLSRSTCKLQALSIRMADLGKIGVSHVFNGLVHNESINSIRFERTCTNADDTSLSSSELGQSLASVVLRNTTLQYLRLPNNNLNTEVVIELATAMRTNTSISEIILSHNLIHGTTAAMAISDMLMHNTTLTVLDLSFNQIGDDEIGIFLDNGLQQNKTLKELLLTGNLFNDASATSIKHMLIHNTGLTNLVLGHIRFSHESIRTVFTGLEWNESLRKLAIITKDEDDRNEQSIVALIKSIIESLKYNQTLVQLRTGYFEHVPPIAKILDDNRNGKHVIADKAEHRRRFLYELLLKKPNNWII